MYKITHLLLCLHAISFVTFKVHKFKNPNLSVFKPLTTRDKDTNPSRTSQGNNLSCKSLYQNLLCRSWRPSHDLPSWRVSQAQQIQRVSRRPRSSSVELQLSARWLLRRTCLRSRSLQSRQACTGMLVCCKAEHLLLCETPLLVPNQLLSLHSPFASKVSSCQKHQ